ncbi:MAG: ferredoxin [Blastocatellales bacterium]
MADQITRLPENVNGAFYVDSRCVDCEVCRDIAPDNFKRIVARRYLIVYQQPVNAEQESLCREAMECCPVEAIGCDKQS